MKEIKNFLKKIMVAIITWEAKMVLVRKKPFIIGVTGNLGKTSTKDAIFSVMKNNFYVRRSDKSMNSEFGVPLTILGEKSGWNNPLKWLMIVARGLFVPFSRDYPTHLVLEIGADRVGDIKEITKWIKPNITVVTQFGQVPVHIEFFPDRDAVIAEKAHLVSALKKDGLFIYNADDYDTEKLLDKTSARKISFGINNKSDVQAINIKPFGNLEGVEADVLIDEKNNHIVLLDVIGKSPIYCSLPALAVAKELNIPFDVACMSLRDADKPKGRMRLLNGVNNSVIIDDSYNASPKAAEHGLHTLASIDAHRKIAVIGDMMELGKHSRDEHYKIGQIASKSCHKLVAVGIRARAIVEGALDSGMSDENILGCDNSIEAGKELMETIKEGDVIYIKGSQSMRMEKLVKMILASEHNPEHVLVRQDKEWLER